MSGANPSLYHAEIHAWGTVYFKQLGVAPFVGPALTSASAAFHMKRFAGWLLVARKRRTSRWPLPRFGKRERRADLAYGTI